MPRTNRKSIKDYMKTHPPTKFDEVVKTGVKNFTNNVKSIPSAFVEVGSNIKNFLTKPVSPRGRGKRRGRGR